MKYFKKFIPIALGLTILLIGSLLLVRQDNAEEVYVEPDQSQVYQDQPVSDDLVEPTVKSGLGRPVHIEILDANISLPVKDGYYNYKNQQWTLSKSSAQYAVMSPKPNQSSGNTFIYGHNRKNVFSNLLNIKQGSVALVTTDNNQKFIYRFKYSYTTNPSDNGLLYYEGPPQLTLQTCSGANFENRTLFVYEFIGVTNA